MTTAGRTFVDTNVLLYAHDASEIEKQPIAERCSKTCGRTARAC